MGKGATEIDVDLVKGGDAVEMARLAQAFFKERADEDVNIVDVLKFWDYLHNARVATAYITVLLTKLCMDETGKGGKKNNLVDHVRQMVAGEPNTKARDPSKISDAMRAQHVYIVGTLYFVVLNYSFDSNNKAFKTALLSIQRSRGIATPGASKIAASEGVVGEVLKMLEPNYITSQDCVINLVDKCSNITFARNFSVHSLTEEHFRGGLINWYLKREIGKGAQTQLIFDTILLFLKHPLLPEAHMLSLLHMLRNLITLCPTVSPDMLLSALPIVKSLYLWPLPYGNVAKELLQLITIELKSPGAAMRERFFTELPNLCKDGKPTGKERIIHVLADQGSANVASFQDLIRSAPKKEASVKRIQMQLLGNIYQKLLAVDPAKLGMERCSRADIAYIFNAAVEIVNQSVLMSKEDSTKYREKELTALKEFISSKSTEGSADKDAAAAAATGGSAAAADAAAAAAPTAESYAPELPPMLWEFLPVKCANTMPRKQDEKLSSVFQYPFRKSSMQTLSNILNKYVPYAVPPRKPIVKIAVLGGDASLHNILCGYVCLKNEKPKLFEGLDLRFYVIPIDHSAFGAFLAKYDGWYGRHVYCLCNCILNSFPRIVDKSKSNVPGGGGAGRDKGMTTDKMDRAIEALQVYQAKKQKDAATNNGLEAHSASASAAAAAALPTPGSVLRDEISSYVREANHRLNANIYQCECWEPHGDDLRYFTVPFLMSVELGINAAATAIQQGGAQKSFKFAPPALSLKFTQMNVMAEPRQAPPIDAQAYRRIVISNVINPMNPAGVEPNPVKPWLEMFVSEGDVKKKKVKLAEDIPQADMGVSYHISAVEIESGDKRKHFEVLIDGQVYGPFVKVKVTPCATPNEEAIYTLPVMTHFPLDLP